MSKVTVSCETVKSPTTSRNNHNDTTKIRSSSAYTKQIVTSLITVLLRGGSRQETLCAVSNLLKLCNAAAAVGENSLENDIIEEKAIFKAFIVFTGTLEILLRTWSRVHGHDWPEIEHQLLQVISILVTYEEDQQLLKRNADTILTALYTLQIKSTSVVLVLLSPTGDDDDTIKSDNEEAKVDEQEHMKGLIAAAVVKLSSVLSSEYTSILLNFIVTLSVNTSPTATDVPVVAAITAAAAVPSSQSYVSPTVIQCSVALLHLGEVTSL